MDRVPSGGPMECVTRANFVVEGSGAKVSLSEAGTK